MNINIIYIIPLLAVYTAGQSLTEFAATIATVSKQVADYYLVDCIQLYYAGNLTLKARNTIFRVWKSTAVVETGITTGVYSYDTYLARKRNKPRKVSCYRSLKLISDEPGSRRGYIALTSELTIKDAVWMLFSTTLSLEFFRHANIMFDDHIIIAVIKTNDLIVFYEIYRISENFPLKIQVLGNWTRQNGLKFPEGALYDRRSDLQGVVLKVASIENWPASYRIKGKWKGFLIKVWNEIKSLINCTSVAVQPPADNSIGMRMDNGSWSGLVGMAVRGEIDVLLSEIVIDKERSQVLKFLYPIMKTRFHIYTRHLGYDWQWSAILKPFHVSVWLASLSWIVVGTTAISFCHRFCLRQGLEPPDQEKAFTPTRSFLFVVQALCQQGYSVIPTSYTCRVLFFVAYAVSGVLIPSYSASLVSSLTQKVHYESFNSLQDMVKDGTYHLLVKENSAQHAFFAHAKDNFLRSAYEKLAKDVPIEMRRMGLKKSIGVLCQLPKYAIMGIEEIIEVRMSGNRRPACPIVHLKNPVSVIHLTIATSKKSPFSGLINYHLERLVLNGVVSRLKHLEFPPRDKIRSDTDKEVGVPQLISAFVFIGVFTVISIIILLLEIQYYLYTTSKIKYKRKKRHFQKEQIRIIQEYESSISKKLRS